MHKSVTFDELADQLSLASGYDEETARSYLWAMFDTIVEESSKEQWIKVKSFAHLTARWQRVRDPAAAPGLDLSPHYHIHETTSLELQKRVRSARTMVRQALNRFFLGLAARVALLLLLAGGLYLLFAPKESKTASAPQKRGEKSAPQDNRVSNKANAIASEQGYPPPQDKSPLYESPSVESPAYKSATVERSTDESPSYPQSPSDEGAPSSMEISAYTEASVYPQKPDGDKSETAEKASVGQTSKKQNRLAASQAKPAKALTPKRTAPHPSQKAPLRTSAGHSVKEGETLLDISRLHYGLSIYWPLIFLNNQANISDPDTIPTGLYLKIPPQSDGEKLKKAYLKVYRSYLKTGQQGKSHWTLCKGLQVIEPTFLEYLKANINAKDFNTVQKCKDR